MDVTTMNYIFIILFFIGFILLFRFIIIKIASFLKELFKRKQPEVKEIDKNDYDDDNDDRIWSFVEPLSRSAFDSIKKYQYPCTIYDVYLDRKFREKNCRRNPAHFERTWF